ncbi:hypothetical protein PPEP_b0911 [Pseudoalteromonas peptidolytica F12-50-A1]|uniref:Uncharacterized protein n=1 Tax=Pseudoalteromonas peptidolytica F12-50-A1 TaxID=1315280 RepID=A0A8I0T702_9GAMM|nr:hypothetical protein [Pseudoalteromonas peptidolytica F12-50-A1]
MVQTNPMKKWGFIFQQLFYACYIKRTFYGDYLESVSIY